ncbi:PHOSPHO2 [Bugula neritina]|uniref:PHOSPHO2 n=1 Tax=Bugula neritina TaxID=10212 RepID=A0A7J7JH66_BUGNE|nr:PHOSPHO2 [Bugula neritina]
MPYSLISYAQFILELKQKLCLFNCCNVSLGKECLSSLSGAVIKDHIESMRKAGTLYSTVCYTGDGENDFCPSLRLTENDYVFPRATFPLEQMLKSRMSEVKAQVVPWKSATVIKQKLQSLATQ